MFLEDFLRWSMCFYLLRDLHRANTCLWFEKRGASLCCHPELMSLNSETRRWTGKRHFLFKLKKVLLKKVIANLTWFNTTHPLLNPTNARLHLSKFKVSRHQSISLCACCCCSSVCINSDEIRNDVLLLGEDDVVVVLFKELASGDGAEVVQLFVSSFLLGNGISTVTSWTCWKKQCGITCVSRHYRTVFTCKISISISCPPEWSRLFELCCCCCCWFPPLPYVPPFAVNLLINSDSDINFDNFFEILDNNLPEGINQAVT